MAYTTGNETERGGLESREGFRRDQGPAMAPREGKGHAHFGMSPYWELTKNRWFGGP